MSQTRNVIRFRPSRYANKRNEIARSLSKMFNCYFKIVYHSDISSNIQMNRSLQCLAASIFCYCDTCPGIKNMHTNDCYINNYFLVRVKRNGECYNLDKTDYIKIYTDLRGYDSETKPEAKSDREIDV